MEKTTKQFVKCVAKSYVKSDYTAYDKCNKIVAKDLEIATHHITAELGSKAAGVPTN